MPPAAAPTWPIVPPCPFGSVLAPWPAVARTPRRRPAVAPIATVEVRNSRDPCSTPRVKVIPRWPGRPPGPFGRFTRRPCRPLRGSRRTPRTGPGRPPRRRRERARSAPTCAASPRSGVRVLVHDPARKIRPDEHARAQRDKGDESLRLGADGLRRLLVHVDLAGDEEEVVADAVEHDAEIEHPDERAVVAQGERSSAPPTPACRPSASTSRPAAQRTTASPA